MLSKKERFTRAAFEAYIKDPGLKTTYNKLGTLKYLPYGHRLAVVTSSKHEKTAVGRNRLRRRVYDRFRASSATITGILYASKQSYHLTSDELHKLADALFLKKS